MSNHDSDDSKNQKPKTPLTPFGGWSTPQDGGPQPVVSQPDGSQAKPSQDDVFKGQKKGVDYTKIRSFSATFGVVNNSIEKLDEALEEAEEEFEQRKQGAANERQPKPQMPKLDSSDPFSFNPDELPPEVTPRKMEAQKGETLKTAVESHSQLASGFTFASGSVVGTASIIEVEAEAAQANAFDNPFDLSPEKEEETVSSSWNFSADDSNLPATPQEEHPNILAEIENEISPPVPEEDMLFNPFKIALKESETTPILSDEENAPGNPYKAKNPLPEATENDPFALPDFLVKDGKKPNKSLQEESPEADKDETSPNNEATKTEEEKSILPETKEEPASAIAEENPFNPFLSPETDAASPTETNTTEEAIFNPFALPETGDATEQKQPSSPIAEEKPFNPFASPETDKEETATSAPKIEENTISSFSVFEDKPLASTSATDDEPKEAPATSTPLFVDEPAAPPAEEKEPVSKDDSIPQPMFESGEQVGQDRLLVNSDEQEITFNPLHAPESDPFSISDFTEEANAPAAEHTPAFAPKTAPAPMEEANQPHGHDSYGEAPQPEEPEAPLPPYAEDEEEAFLAPASHSDAEVETILALHMEWLQSRGKEGRRANFRNASLEQYDFSQQNLSEASFRGANLNGATFAGALLQGADLSEASLVGVNFSGADLSNVMAMRADIRHSALENSCLVNADFTGASLSGANLRHLDMSGVTLMEADLHHADLQGSLLRGSNLRAANFAHANLHEVDLSGANCRAAIFNHARVTFANMEGTNLKASRLEGVDFKGTDITRTEDLDPEYTHETMQAGMEQLNEEWGKLEQKSSELEQTRNLLESERNRLTAEKQQLMDELEATRRDKQTLEGFVHNVDEAFKRHKKSIKKLKIFTILWGLITLAVAAGIFLLINALELKTLDWIELSVVFGFSIFILGMFISTTLRCLAITSNFRKLRELMQQRITDSH